LGCWLVAGGKSTPIRLTGRSSHQQTAIDAVQLEFGADYTGKEQRQKTAETLADALAAYAAKYLQSPPQAGQ
jgi:hypothetical protein